MKGESGRERSCLFDQVSSQFDSLKAQLRGGDGVEYCRGALAGGEEQKWR